MMSNGRQFFRFLRCGAAVAAGMMLVAVPVSILSIAAIAGEEKPDAAFRLYLAIPFIATAERQPARLGFQLMQQDSVTSFAPLETEQRMQTTLDLGFTHNGLAKFDVNGASAMSAYEAFAHAIGLTPDEIELCRETDCLDWVKEGEGVAVPAGEAAVRLGE